MAYGCACSGVINTALHKCIQYPAQAAILAALAGGCGYIFDKPAPQEEPCHGTVKQTVDGGVIHKHCVIKAND